MSGISWLKHSSGLTLPGHIGAGLRMRPEVAQGGSAAPPFEIADLGADISNYWNVDLGRAQTNATKIADWTAELGQQSTLSQPSSSYQLIQYKYPGRTDHWALQPSWASAGNHMAATLATPLAAPYTRYFTFFGPESGDQFLLSASGGGGMTLFMSVTGMGLSLPGTGQYSASVSYKGLQAFPIPRLSWHTMAIVVDTSAIVQVYLDDPKTPWVLLDNREARNPITRVSFFNETGGTSWWNHIGDILDCKSAHDETKRSNVFAKMRSRFYPPPSTPTEGWTPLVLGAPLIGWYEVDQDGVVYDPHALADGDCSGADPAASWGAYNCTLSYQTVATPFDNPSGKVLRVTLTNTYGGMFNTNGMTNGNVYRIRGWTRAQTSSYVSRVDWSDNTAIWDGNPNTDWQRFDLFEKRRADCGVVYRSGGYAGNWCEYAQLHTDCFSVQRLKDRSGRGNHVDAPAAQLPFYVVSSTGRGKGALRFDGVNDLLKAAFTTSGVVHMVLAFKATGNGSATNKTIVDGGTNNSSRLYYDGSGHLVTAAGGQVGPQVDYAVNNWTVVDVVFQAGSNLTKIGIKGGTLATGTTTATNGGFSIGGLFGGTEFSEMDFFGGILVNGELSAADRANAVAYFKDRVAEGTY